MTTWTNRPYSIFVASPVPWTSSATQEQNVNSSLYSCSRPAPEVGPLKASLCLTEQSGVFTF